jgi:hypothetical protein
MARNRPDLGLTPGGRTDPRQAIPAAEALAQENAGALKRAGLPATNANLHASHILGAPTAPQVLAAPDDMPMARLISPAAIAANPQIAQMTAGQFKAWVARQQGGRQPAQQGMAFGSGAYPSRETLVKMLQNPQTRPQAVEIITAMRGGKALPDDVREYQFAQSQGETRPYSEWKVEMKRAGANSVNIDQRAESAFGVEASKGQAQSFQKVVDDGLAAGQDAALLGQLRELGGRVETGGGAAVKNWLGQYGVKTEGLSDIQAYQALVDKLVPQQRVPGSGATSDFEMRTFRNAIPGLIKTPEGNKAILDTLEGLAQYRQDRAEIAARALAKEISPAQAIKQMQSLPDPLAAFKASRQGASAPASGSLAPIGDNRFKWTPGQ